MKNYEGTVTQEVLFNAFVKATSYGATNLPPHTSISEIMKTWTENIGYPLITIARCYHHGEVTIKQVGILFVAFIPIDNEISKYSILFNLN